MNVEYTYFKVLFTVSNSEREAKVKVQTEGARWVEKNAGRASCWGREAYFLKCFSIHEYNENRQFTVNNFCLLFHQWKKYMYDWCRT
jgi:hypothetical protein